MNYQFYLIGKTGKLSIAIAGDMCYTSNCLDEQNRGVLLLNAVTKHNISIVGKAPLVSGLTSRCSSRQRRQANKGRFVMFKLCNTCQQVKPISEFGKDKSKRDGCRTQCKECTRSQSLKHYYELTSSPQQKEAIKEHRRNYMRQRLQDNQIRNQTNIRRQSLRKTDEYRAMATTKQRERRHNNSEFAERQRETSRKYRSRVRGDLNKSIREKYATDPEFRKLLNRRSQIYHAKKTGNGGSYTEQEWIDLCNFYGNICLKCKQPKPLTVDHVIPVSRGGSSNIDNIQPLCLECNCAKRDRVADYRSKQ